MLCFAALMTQMVNQRIVTLHEVPTETSLALRRRLIEPMTSGVHQPLLYRVKPLRQEQVVVDKMVIPRGHENSHCRELTTIGSPQYIGSSSICSQNRPISIY